MSDDSTPSLDALQQQANITQETHDAARRYAEVIACIIIEKFNLFRCAFEASSESWQVLRISDQDTQSMWAGLYARELVIFRGAHYQTKKHQIMSFSLPHNPNGQVQLSTIPGDLKVLYDFVKFVLPYLIERLDRYNVEMQTELEKTKKMISGV